MLQNYMHRAATRPSDLKRNNRIQILELFKSGMVYSVADIAREIGISRQTVMKAVQFFLEKGIIVSEGKASSGSMGGKRAELFSLPADRCLFNILLCPEGLRVSLLNVRGEIIDIQDRPGVKGLSIDAIAEAAWRLCEQMLKAKDIGLERVLGACVCSAGIVERRTQRLRFNSLFPEWGNDIPIAEKLGAYFGDSVLVMTENIGKVCGCAVLHDSPDGSVATVFSGWGGIVASQMVGGMILSGKDSLIGEIGHMLLAPDDDEVCGCGSRGCFERQVSVERLRNIIGRMKGDYPDSPLAKMAPEDITIPGIFEASAAGDALGQWLSAYAARFFAGAMRNLTLMFNPDKVIFQGVYAFADEVFRRTLFEELAGFRYYEAGGAPFELEMDRRSLIELSTMGAYTLLIDRLFNDETILE